ncbi:hypothetical protein ACTXT7_016953 [Hymenolepis weldensis]
MADVSFYQWVPFAPALQTIPSFLPHLMWQSLTVNTLSNHFKSLVTHSKAANTSGDVEIGT